MARLNDVNKDLDLWRKLVLERMLRYAEAGWRMQLERLDLNPVFVGFDLLNGDDQTANIFDWLIQEKDQKDAKHKYNQTLTADQKYRDQEVADEKKRLPDLYESKFNAPVEKSAETEKKLEEHVVSLGSLTPSANTLSR